MNRIDRRRFLGACGAGLALSCARHETAETLPPVRAITSGPKHHWFGYYDKLEFDSASRRVLGMQVAFEHRSPRPEDEIRIGMVDIEEGDTWTDLGSSSAWGWQQGCMLQWIPGFDSEVIWNDREDDKYVSRILDVDSGTMRTIPSPVYALGPDGLWAVSTDFRRLNDTRSGYGYVGIPDPNSDVLAPEDVGIWKVDLTTGGRHLLISVAQAATIPNPHSETEGMKHYFNHLLVSPDGSRLIFLHRWRNPSGSGGFGTLSLHLARPGPRVRIRNPHPFTIGSPTTSWRGPGIRPTRASSTSTGIGPKKRRLSLRTSCG